MKEKNSELQFMKREYRRIGVIHVIIILCGIIINYCMEMFVHSHDFPLYLDTIGTIVVAWECGFFSCIIVALLSNLTFGIIHSDLTTYFAVVGIGVGMLSAIMFKENFLKKKYGPFLFPLIIGSFSGIAGGLIQWALAITGPDAIPKVLGLNIIDKTVSSIVAFLIVKLLPEKIRFDIWSYDLNYNLDKNEYEFKQELTIEQYVKNNRRVLLVLIVEASLLTAVIAWTGVTIYASNAHVVYEYALSKGVDLAATDVFDYSKDFLVKVSLVAIAFLCLTLSIGLWLAGRHQRMAESQYKQIQMAKDEAERANLAKSRFIANISHELRTPINTIMGMNEMIMREESEAKDNIYSETINQYAENIKQASELLLGLVNDILDLSKIESGKMTLVEMEYDSEEMIRSIINMMKIRSESKGLSFYTQIDPQLPKHLLGDEGRIKEVVLNLLSNALKYTDEGGFTLRISVAERTEDRCRISFVVKDTGRGIREEEIDKIFSAFERADEKKNISIQGTGLGLNLAKQFSTLMGGELRCESIYGKGSTFYFTLEQTVLDNELVGNVLEKETETRAVYVPLFTAPGAKLLAVDDNQLNLQVIKGLLKGLQIQVTTAMSGGECLDMLHDKDFDVVLLDHMMPEMDGIETLEHIRAEHKHIPVIALTANASNDGGSYYRLKGFDDYLSKPVDSLELEKTLQKFIPKELQQVVNPEDYDKKQYILSDENKWLEDVSGLSVQAGIGNCGSEEVYVKAINTFRDTIEENCRVIKTAWKEGNIDLYTIKVHALKSSARIIGAKALSDKAKELEAAGKANDTKFIDDNTEKTLDLYAEYIKKLQPKVIKAIQKVKPEIGEGELQDASDAVREFIAQMDYDSLEVVINQLKDYKLPADAKKRMDEFEKAFISVDWDKMEELMK